MIATLCAVLAMCILAAIAQRGTLGQSTIDHACPQHSLPLIRQPAIAGDRVRDAQEHVESNQLVIQDSGRRVALEIIELGQTVLAIADSINCRICGESGSREVQMCECPGCGAPFHDDCWAYNGGCAIYGCTSRPPILHRPEPQPEPTFLTFQPHVDGPPRNNGGASGSALRTASFRCRNCLATITRPIRNTPHYISCTRCQFSIRIDPDDLPIDSSPRQRVPFVERTTAPPDSAAVDVSMNRGSVFAGRSFSSQYLRRTRREHDDRSSQGRAGLTRNDSDQSNVGRDYRLALESGATSIQEPRTSLRGLRSAIVRDSSGNLWLNCGEGWEHIGHQRLPGDYR